MKRVIALSCVLACAVIAQAQPQPGAGAGSGSGSNTTSEKAGKDETLQNGATGGRPWAAGVAPAEQQAALKLFHDGNTQLNDGLFAKAAENYKQALKHWDHPAIHYNLSLAQMNLDQLIDAYANLEAAVRYGDAPLQSKEKYDNAKRYQGLLEKQIADIEINCDKVGAKVSVDGQIVFTAPGTYKAKVKAGKHTFVAEKEGYTTNIDAPWISSGAPFRIDLKLYTAEELTRYRRKWDQTWIPYAVMGGGALVGAIGGILELSASNKYKQYDDQVAACNQQTGGNGGCPTSASLTSIKSSGDSMKAAGFVMYGVAGVAIATGIALAIINRPESYQIRAEDLRSEKVTVAPVLAPGIAGAQIQGHF